MSEQVTINLNEQSEEINFMLTDQSEEITVNLNQPTEEIKFALTDQKEEVVFSFSEAARGATGATGASATVDQTIIDGSTNAVSGNAVFDALALKAPLANPTFTGIVTAPRITGRCDGLEVFCKAGLAINAGQVVYVTGASGTNIIIGLAQANAEATSSKTIGISESTLAHNATGYVITEGLLTVSISAPTANEGDPIWLSPTTAGGMVFGLANKPFAPNHMVYLGVVTRKTGNTVVEIFVKVQNGAELDELADVLITNPVAGQALMRGATLWENRSLVSADISDATSAATANTLVLRDGTGGSNFAAVGATSVTSSGAISTTGLNGFITTNGYDATITTTGDNGFISTIGQTASISTSGDEASIYTSGSVATISTSGIDAWINTTGISAHIFTSGSGANIETQGTNGYIQSRSTFRLYDGTYATTLSHNPTAERAIAFPNDAGTLALTNPSSGSQTFTGSQTFSGAVSATGQGQLSSLSDSGVITKSLLNAEIGGNGVCALLSVSATGGTQTTTQFAQANGTLGFGSAPIAGQAALHITYQPPNIIESGSSWSSNTGGGGSIVDMRLNHALVVPIGLPSNATARDVEVRIIMGSAATSGTNNAKLGALAGRTGYGLRIVKHPTNNTYEARLTGRTSTLTGNITGATNASPIVITNSSHGLLNGDLVEITGVLGNTAANGVFTVQNAATNTFELASSTGNGVYSSGGQVARLSSSSIELAPFTTQVFCFKWTASTNTVSLIIGDLDQSEVLSLNRIALTHNCSMAQTTGLRIGFSSVTDATASLGISYGQPTMLRI